MSAPGSADVADALDHLVHQFADPLAFLRELVQNSIDAGSAEVAVSCQFTPEPGLTSTVAAAAPGTLIIRVDDWGSGMDRQIIDHRLTRLFASDKTGDRTKIGKFGIGFVSVFALSPDAVCVDTGQAGESWRVLFRADRSFTRLRLREPVEGTKIQLLKAMTRGAAAALTERVEKALRLYCRHVRIDLRYAGQLISGPLTLVGPEGDDTAVIEVAAHEAELQVVVGLTPPQRPDIGSYYNRGLLLLEQPSALPGFSFKVDSPRLAHTLSRDALIKDRHYAQAMAVVQRLAGGALVEQLSERLETALTAGAPEPQLRALQERLAACLHKAPLPAACATRVCARSPHGELLTLAACQRAAARGELFMVGQPSPLSQRIGASGRVVLTSWQGELARALLRGGDPPMAAIVFVLPLRLAAPGAVDPGGHLQAEMLALFAGIGAAVAAVVLGQLDYPGAAPEPPPAVAQQQPFELSAQCDTTTGQALLSGIARTLVINVAHPLVQELLPLAGREPELAAYTLAKRCLMGAVLPTALDGRLLTVAMERRCRRCGP